MKKEKDYYIIKIDWKGDPEKLIKEIRRKVKNLDY